MHQPDHPSAVASVPAPQAAGTPGWYRGGDTGTGVQGTVVHEDHLNAITAELLGIRALHPDGDPGDDKTDNGQLAAALVAYITKAAALPRGGLYGLVKTFNAGLTTITISPGEARNAGHTVDLTVGTSITKDLTATFAVGTGNGMVPDNFTAPPADGWYRLFLVAQPNGVPDLTIDTSPTAANFFADGVAAGTFTDTTLYRRIGWVRVVSGVFVKFINDPDDPSRYVWDVPTADLNTDGPTIGSSPRVAFGLTAPPLVRAELGAYMRYTPTAWGVPGCVVFTDGDQTDSPASGTNYHLKCWGVSGGTLGEVAAAGFFVRTNAASQIYVDINPEAASWADRIDVITHGWIDKGVIA